MIELPRIRVYIASSMFLWVMAYAAIYIGTQIGVTPYLMALNPLPWQLALVWTAFGLFAGFAIIVGFRAFNFRESDMMENLVPRTTLEKIFYVVLALSAGICEEVIFRGFATSAVYAKTGSLIAGIAISSVVFGLLHMHQRAGGAVRATLLGVVLAFPVVATGSVIPSMAAHAIIDLAGGLWLAKWLFK